MTETAESSVDQTPPPTPARDNAVTLPIAIAIAVVASVIVSLIMHVVVFPAEKRLRVEQICFHTPASTGPGAGDVCFAIDASSGNLIASGARVDFRQGAAVEGPLFFYHRGALGWNDTDEYTLEKINAGPDQNTLRLTLSDNQDEALEIWGNSCVQGACGGPGVRAFRFQADGQYVLGPETT